MEKVLERKLQDWMWRLPSANMEEIWVGSVTPLLFQCGGGRFAFGVQLGPPDLPFSDLGGALPENPLPALYQQVGARLLGGCLAPGVLVVMSMAQELSAKLRSPG